MLHWLYDTIFGQTKNMVATCYRAQLRRIRVLLRVLSNASKLLGAKYWIAASLILLLPLGVYAYTNTYAAVFVAASSQYAKRSGTTGFPSGTGARTIALWYKASSNAASQCLFDSGNAAGNRQEFGLCVNINGAGTDDFAIVLNGGNVHYTATNITNGSWHFLAFTYDGSGNGIATGGKAYMDGSALTQSSANDTVPATVTNCTAIGATESTGTCGGYGNFINGTLDDVRFWSRALSSSDLSSLYSDPCNFSNGASLSGWWTLDNGFGDASGNVNDLTAVNSPTFTTTGLPFTSCSAGGATPSNFGTLLFFGW